MNSNYILDDLTLAEAINLRYEIDREIWRRWKAGKKRDELIDRYDELSMVIYNLEQEEEQ